MGLSDWESAESASSRFRVDVIGGDAVFLVDRRLGQKVYVGLEERPTRPELRRYVASLQHDLKHLTIGDFFSKYDLRG